MLEQFDRPLTGAEKGILRRRVTECRTRLRRGPREALLVAGAIGAVLCVVTLLASDAPWRVVVGFWTAAVLVVAAWALIAARRDLLGTVRRLEEALELDRADVVRVQADAMVEFEEIEDEGAEFAFRIGEGRLLWVAGQDFYPSKRFPSRDFSLVHIRDREGTLVEMRIECQGEKLEPLRTVPADLKRTLAVPGHLETLAVEIAELERALAR